MKTVIVTLSEAEYKQVQDALENTMYWCYVARDKERRGAEDLLGRLRNGEGVRWEEKCNSQ